MNTEQQTSPVIVSLLDYLLSENRVRMVDIKLAELLCEHQHDDVFYLILLLSNAQQSQHSCLTLNELDWQNPFNLRQAEFSPLVLSVPDSLSPFNDGFSTEQALICLQHHASVGSEKPLLLFDNRLYFARLAGYEHTLAQRLLQMSQQAVTVDNHALAQLLERYFPTEQTDSTEPQKIDWQKVACAMAATKGFSVITGGPGTGKTTTVTKLLAILQSLYQHAPLSIKLVAPTGKAAARLSLSLIHI